MKNLSSLEDILPPEFLPFLHCLENFRDTLDSCFGYSLDPFYKDVIQRFRTSFDVLRSLFGCSETNKLHIIFNHIGDFIEIVGKPLGEFSEQELESSHSSFAKIWARYKVKQLKSAFFAPNYLKAVLTFNSLHIEEWEEEGRLRKKLMDSVSVSDHYYELVLQLCSCYLCINQKFFSINFPYSHN